MTKLHLGKTPAAPDKRDLLYRNYAVSDGSAPPTRFGFDGFVSRTGWGMLGNDEVGDCVWADAAHEHMILTGGNHRASTMAQFTTEVVLSDYSAATGYDPADPSTDQGTDMHEAAKYRRATGILDATGKRHKIGAYVWLTPGRWDEYVQALYTFETISIGIEFPASAMDQFNRGEPWSVVPGSPIKGGHAITGGGLSSAARTQIVTWATLHPMTREFYETYSDEACAFISEDTLAAGGKSLRGLDLAALTTDLAELGH